MQTEGQEDGLVFEQDPIEVHPIREEQEYGGQRITLPARLGNARIRLQIDIGFGDAITPGPQKVQYPTLLHMPAPEILTYPKETVIAEKLHTIVVLGITNSRMKDYYDLWDLSREYEFDGNLLSQAIRATFERRKTEVPDGLPPALTEVFYKDNAVITRWNAFIEKTELSVVEKNFETVVRLLQIFCGDILESLSKGNRFDKKWDRIGWRKPPE